MSFPIINGLSAKNMKNNLLRNVPVNTNKKQVTLYNKIKNVVNAAYFEAKILFFLLKINNFPSTIKLKRSITII